MILGLCTLLWGDRLALPASLAPFSHDELLLACQQLCEAALCWLPSTSGSVNVDLDWGRVLTVEVEQLAAQALGQVIVLATARAAAAAAPTAAESDANVSEPQPESCTGAGDRADAETEVLQLVLSRVCRGTLLPNPELQVRALRVLGQLYPSRSTLPHRVLTLLGPEILARLRALAAPHTPQQMPAALSSCSASAFGSGLDHQARVMGEGREVQFLLSHVASDLAPNWRLPLSQDEGNMAAGLASELLSVLSPLHLAQTQLLQSGLRCIQVLVAVCPCMQQRELAVSASHMLLQYGLRCTQVPVLAGVQAAHEAPLPGGLGGGEGQAVAVAAACAVLVALQPEVQDGCVGTRLLDALGALALGGGGSGSGSEQLLEACQEAAAVALAALMNKVSQQDDARLLGTARAGAAGHIEELLQPFLHASPVDNQVR